MQPLLPLTVDGLLRQTAKRIGNNEALVVPHQSVRWTWNELQNRVEKFAAGFRALGLKPGDRIGIWAPNCWEWVVTQFASARAGLILVNINPAYRLGELSYALEKTGCAALIVTPALKSSNYVEMLNELVPELAGSCAGKLESSKFPNLKTLLLLGDKTEAGFIAFNTLPDMATAQEFNEVEMLQNALQFDDPINIQFTSGTTGTPVPRASSHQPKSKP
jgi:fatty-acyl-CoA synthase